VHNERVNIGGKIVSYLRERNEEDATAFAVRESAITDYCLRVFRRKPDAVNREVGINVDVPFVERPVGRLLLETLESGDALVTDALATAFQSARDCAHALQLLEARSVALHVVSIGKSGDAFRKTVAGFAELEAQRVRERMLDAHARRRAAGRHVTGRLPFGYVQLEGGVLAEDPRQQEAIRRMRELRADGKSFRAIQADLKSEFDITLSPWGIQRVVEHRRQTDEEAIRQAGQPAASQDIKPSGKGSKSLFKRIGRGKENGTDEK